MASQAGAWSRLFLQRSKLTLQPACGLDRGIWLNGCIDEAALRAFVGMHNEALFREGASDPVSGGSAIWTGRSSGARHGSTSLITISAPNNILQNSCYQGKVELAQIEGTRSILFWNGERGTTLERSAAPNILQTHIGSPLTVVHLHVSPYANCSACRCRDRR